jgi:phosphoglycolate phosphatase-like HAD superfamily hydrolase
LKCKNVFIFDWDGTVLDNFLISLENIEKIAKDIKISLPDKNSREFKEIWGNSVKIVLEFCFRGYGLKEINQKWRKLEINTKLDLINRAEETIKELKKRGNIVGIITNRTWGSFETFEHLWGPLNFDFIQTSEYRFKRWLKYRLNLFGNHLATKKFKPHPECFKPVFKWLKRKRIKPIKVYYIGDSLPDYEVVTEANKRYGYNIEFIAVLTGPIKTRREWYEMTGARFLTLRSIVDLILWLNDKGDE